MDGIYRKQIREDWRRLSIIVECNLSASERCYPFSLSHWFTSSMLLWRANPGSAMCSPVQMTIWHTSIITWKSRQMASKWTKFAKVPFPKEGMRWLHSLACGTITDDWFQISQPLYKPVLELIVTASDVDERSVAKLKDELCDGIAVKLPNPNKPFAVHTTESIQAFMQSFSNAKGKRCILRSSLVKHSMLLNLNYSSYDRELLAVLKACNAFRVYLVIGNLAYALTKMHIARSSIPLGFHQVVSRIGCWR